MANHFTFTEQSSTKQTSLQVDNISMSTQACAEQTINIVSIKEGYFVLNGLT